MTREKKVLIFSIFVFFSVKAAAVSLILLHVQVRPLQVRLKTSVPAPDDAYIYLRSIRYFSDYGLSTEVPAMKSLEEAKKELQAAGLFRIKDIFTLRHRVIFSPGSRYSNRWLTGASGLYGAAWFIPLGLIHRWLDTDLERLFIFSFYLGLLLSAIALAYSLTKLVGVWIAGLTMLAWAIFNGGPMVSETWFWLAPRIYLFPVFMLLVAQFLVGKAKLLPFLVLVPLLIFIHPGGQTYIGFFVIYFLAEVFLTKRIDREKLIKLISIIAVAAITVGSYKVLLSFNFIPPLQLEPLLESQMSELTTPSRILYNIYGMLQAVYERHWLQFLLYPFIGLLFLNGLFFCLKERRHDLLLIYIGLLGVCCATGITLGGMARRGLFSVWHITILIIIYGLYCLVREYSGVTDALSRSAKIDEVKDGIYYRLSLLGWCAIAVLACYSLLFNNPNNTFGQGPKMVLLVTGLLILFIILAPLYVGTSLLIMARIGGVKASVSQIIEGWWPRLHETYILPIMLVSTIFFSVYLFTSHFVTFRWMINADEVSWDRTAGEFLLSNTNENSYIFFDGRESSEAFTAYGLLARKVGFLDVYADIGKLGNLQDAYLVAYDKNAFIKLDEIKKRYLRTNAPSGRSYSLQLMKNFGDFTIYRIVSDT